MKKVLLSLAILGSISLFSSCDAIKKKVKEEANVDINFGYDGADATIDIPVITQTNVTTYPDTASMPNNVQDQIAQANAMLTMSNIEKVIVTGAKLVFNNCDAQNNASNFKTAMVAFYSNTNADLKWIATNDEVPDVNGEEITLVVDENINLKEYLTSSTQIYYVTGVNMRRPTTKVLNATLKISYKLIGNTGYGE